jgi:peptide/nickel transport system ATP-binding protein
MAEKLLEIKNLNVMYKTDLETVYAVNGLDLELEEGRALGIVGETGAGKTTTALSIMRLLPERTAKLSGKIYFKGIDVYSLKESQIRKFRGEKVSMIFQDPMTSLNPVLTVGSQIAEALELHNESGRSKQQIEERVDEILELVGMEPSRKKEYPHQFSGGMKQRIVIAIALACEPELLIADEPTTALDVTIQAQVLMMMKELISKLDTSLIMITHDMGIVAQICDDVAVMYAGEIVEYGTVEDIFNGKYHHPYTRGLFGSIPNLEVETKRLSPIYGLMPDPTDLPKGCKFFPRCRDEHRSCIEEDGEPGYWHGEGKHIIKCHCVVAEEQG